MFVQLVGVLDQDETAGVTRNRCAADLCKRLGEVNVLGHRVGRQLTGRRGLQLLRGLGFDQAEVVGDVRARWFPSTDPVALFSFTITEHDPGRPWIDRRRGSGRSSSRTTRHSSPGLGSGGRGASTVQLAPGAGLARRHLS